MLYFVSYSIEIELNGLKNIAWEASKISNITNEFDYYCLSKLVEVYSLQKLYITEQRKMLNYIIASDYDKLKVALSINNQLKQQLQETIKEAREEIKNCS